ncbi:uncharacterized protein EAE97_006606 [Botrytis byssoidea]|uniref:RBR-type E3 ubiquitin transferase n=1 Tax=Botrytis byssoidea TaxID=139641 RepID=A0A9P5INS8_9HELO|nr:uncharacterized protein EAE97_006606 [Botrytis byssoidea]KAF7941769.1 hypothetical protein EAE97_006606 [Botrytis byssoidea]
MDYAAVTNHHLEGIDNESSNLIIQLLLGDIEDSPPEGNGRANDASDISVAFELQRTELENIALVSSNRHFARDHTMALLQSYQGSPQTKTTPESQSPSSPLTQTNEESTCVSCQNKINSLDAARVPGSCRHEYCPNCLETLFQLSMRDESFFPPRCCNERITVVSVHSFLKTDTISAFAKKELEFETPNRIYCSFTPCSAFIDPTSIRNEVAFCDECGTQTHTVCKLEAHTGDCSEDTVLKEVLELARNEGWQRCYSCWSIVELERGCNHVKCRCGAEFCYICGLRWNSCRCPHWHETRLGARATEAFDRRLEHRLLERPHQAVGQGFAARAQVAVAAQALRNNPAGENRWTYIHGNHMC